MQALEDWIKTHVKKYDGLSPKEIYYRRFFRDSTRPIINDNNYFVSPADGIIIYQKIVKPAEKILEVKGQNYTLEDLLRIKDLPNINYYVVGIFMTLYDVHVNRVPLTGILQFKFEDPIQSNNLPMIFMEKDIFKNKINFHESDYTYLKNNERCVNTIYSPIIKDKYWAVQIADTDVDVITPFNTEKEFVFTGERFSFIRWGSQVDLVIPENKLYDFKFLGKPMMHVTAGTDNLIEIIKK